MWPLANSCRRLHAFVKISVYSPVLVRAFYHVEQGNMSARKAEWQVTKHSVIFSGDTSYIHAFLLAR
jgi:hypothetical protein